MKQRTITGIIFAALFTAFFLPAFWFPITAVIMSVVVGSFVVYELIKALKNGAAIIVKEFAACVMRNPAVPSYVS